MKYSSFLTVLVLTSSPNTFQGVLAENNTTDTDHDEQVETNGEEQLSLNTTDVQPPETPEGGGEDTEVTEEGGTEEVAEEVTTEEVHVARTRSQAFKDWTGHILASKYMGSLAVIYLAICIYLAIQQGPLFVR